LKKRKVIQVFLRGGLGNQLFQYSTGLSLAHEQRRELVLRGDLLPRVEDSIGGVSRWPNQLTDFNHSGMIGTRSYQPSEKTNSLGKSMQVMRLSGDRFPYLLSRIGWLASENSELSIGSLNERISLINSYAPFKELAFRNRETLGRELNQIREPSKEFLELSLEIQKSKAIAVHIRQGDYLNLGHIYGSSTLEFLKSATQELRESLNLKNLWLFSDTPSAITSDVMDSLKPDRVIGPEALPRPIENMLLMSKASGLIAANSSFSWWSAFLTRPGTPVVAPYIARAKVNNFFKDSELDLNWRTLIVE
jgi:hypothetical protein